MALKTVLSRSLTNAVGGGYTPAAGKSFFGFLNLCNRDSSAMTVRVYTTTASVVSDIENIHLEPAGTVGNSQRLNLALSSGDTVSIIGLDSSAQFSAVIQGDEFTT